MGPSKAKKKRSIGKRGPENVVAPAHAIDKFGTFTFRIENIDLGHYSRVLRLPAFALSEQAYSYGHI